MSKKIPIKTNKTISPRNLESQFLEIESMIQSARERAFAVVDTVLVDLYWNIGAYISEKIKTTLWGRSVVANLAEYIQKNIPSPRGFSDKNLWRMKQFYEEYHNNIILSPLVRELSWSQNLVIFSKTKSIEEREFYLKLAHAERYSKRELERQIDSCLFERIITSKPKLSSVVRELHPEADKIFRDAYSLEILGLHDNHSEKDLQSAIITNLKNFIIEFGRDFTFVGEEYRVQVGNTDFFLDLLFYHRELRCLVAVELKINEFKPEYLGKMNFYLEALDRDVKKPHENPSVGLILCKEKNDEVVEYALSRSLSPLAVADYKTKLPDKKLLQQKLHEFYEMSSLLSPVKPTRKRSVKPVLKK